MKEAAFSVSGPACGNGRFWVVLAANKIENRVVFLQEESNEYIRCVFIDDLKDK